MTWKQVLAVVGILAFAYSAFLAGTGVVTSADMSELKTQMTAIQKDRAAASPVFYALVQEVKDMRRDIEHVQKDIDAINMKLDRLKR